jgi:two-component system chemotaxis response regulator CheB
MVTPKHLLRAPGHDIIVVGASAGGVEALQKLVGDFPPELPAVIFIVLHLAAGGPSFLPEILSRAGPLPVSQALNGEAITPGHIYVAPPDHHLLIEQRHIRLSRGPKENRSRPAIDTLFRSAAYAYGPRVIGVVLTGLLDDGTAGLWAIKDRGGLGIVQDPMDALCPSMPRSALQHVAVDYVLPLAMVASTLAQLVEKPAAEEGDYSVSEKLAIETRIARGDHTPATDLTRLGKLSPYSCPECHGVLLQLYDGNILRFRCHTGHAYSLSSLLAEVTESIEESLWSTLRAVEERVLLLRHLAHHGRDQQEDASAAVAAQQARKAERRLQVIREVLMRHDDLGEDQLHDNAG